MKNDEVHSFSDFVNKIAGTSVRIHRTLETRFAVGGVTLSPEKWETLAILADDLEGKRTADGFALGNAASDLIIEILEREGLVRRVIDPTDTRAGRAYLTGKGAIAIGRTIPLLIKLDREITKGMTEMEIGNLERLLRIVEKNLGSLPVSLNAGTVPSFIASDGILLSR
jgi:DNA-binding MarR family transcriptional regulator